MNPDFVNRTAPENKELLSRSMKKTFVCFSLLLLATTYVICFSQLSHLEALNIAAIVENQVALHWCQVGVWQLRQSGANRSDLEVKPGLT